MLKMDKHVHILQVERGATEPVLTEPSEVVMNHNDLGANFSVAPNASFQKRKPWGMTWDEVTEEDIQDPIVKFSFTFLCDDDPLD